MQLSLLDPLYPVFASYTKDLDLTVSAIDWFRELIYTFYSKYKRPLAWRYSLNPYEIVVSEIMLQQTQVDRVVPKYEAFIKAFPSFDTLAQARVSDVIAVWQGLGYNRRALALHSLAQRVITEYRGTLPDSPEVLITFKGIGSATAASICAFAFGKPVVFLETNIRAVYLHTFFNGHTNVHDKALLPLVEVTLDHHDPRSWYYALMDYGVALKKAFKNPTRHSAHYAKQSSFEGSERQIRGLILKALLVHKELDLEGLCTYLDREKIRIERNVEKLSLEGFIKKEGLLFRLTE